MHDNSTLPFERPLFELRARIEDMLKNSEQTEGLENQVRVMRQQADAMEKELYQNLSPWNTVQIARHQSRPTARDYVELALDDFEELHGDRAFRDDLAIVTGLAKIEDERFMLIGQHRGRNVEERHQSHAGCSHPEGYRKALLKMKLAQRFNLPIVCLIDTKGAYPGIGAEERGQGIALAENIREMSLLDVPVICCIIGEGGSGGALALGVGNKLLMLQHAYYSVITPEGCASILWRDGELKAEAAEVLKLTSKDLKERGFIDDIVAEPLGGAHRNQKQAAEFLRGSLLAAIKEVKGIAKEDLAQHRYEKYRKFGEFLSGQSLPEPEEKKPEEAEA